MIELGSTYMYKGVAYLVLAVCTETLVQYEDEWHPSVRYCRAEDYSGGLTFIRSEAEFNLKFRRHV